MKRPKINEKEAEVGPFFKKRKNYKQCKIIIEEDLKALSKDLFNKIDNILTVGSSVTRWFD